MNQESSGLRIGEPGFVFDSARRNVPRRIVRLKGADVAEVLATFEGDAVVGSAIHAEVQRLAAQHPGETLALEWLGNLGWVRFLTCRK
jgi:hypothetical protein